jgi:hypothetical protein
VGVLEHHKTFMLMGILDTGLPVAHTRFSQLAFGSSSQADEAIAMKEGDPQVPGIESTDSLEAPSSAFPPESETGWLSDDDIEDD